MFDYRSSEVILMAFPFMAGTEAKRQLTLVLLDTGDEDVVVVPITSQIYHAKYDVVLVEWQQAGLKLPSVARVHKPITTDKRLVERRVGMLSAGDWTKVCDKLR